MSFLNGVVTNSVLICSQAQSLVRPLRHALSAVGFQKITARPSQVEALEDCAEETFHLVFFDATFPEQSEFTTDQFIEKVLDVQKKAVLIAIASEPSAEEIFHVIKCGAQGYLIPPISPYWIEEVVGQALEGHLLDDEILLSPNRNEALATLVLDNLDRLADYMAKVKAVKLKSSSGKFNFIKDVGNYSLKFAQCVQTSRKFCEGSDQDLLDKIILEAIRRSEEKTRLGTMRKRLLNQRQNK
ncbi:MAG: hypothetical protein KDD53_03095 [Bdellovibrionales bacterium]|nr:hypothetical protein [Bdellovibrionales bacterium]